MSDREAMILAAMHQLALQHGRECLQEDGYVRFVGEAVLPDWPFGDEHRHAHKIGYSPTLSMALGRLVKVGLVEKFRFPAESYSRWRLTSAGAAEAEACYGMLVGG